MRTLITLDMIKAKIFEIKTIEKKDKYNKNNAL